jgi:hypothetical protein
VAGDQAGDGGLEEQGLAGERFYSEGFHAGVHLGRFEARVPGDLGTPVATFGDIVRRLAAHSLVGALHAVLRMLLEVR